MLVVAGAGCLAGRASVRHSCALGARPLGHAAARGGVGCRWTSDVPTGRGIAPGGWLRPGRFGGLPWLFTLGCLTLLPLVVYIISYAPWIALGNAGACRSWGLPFMPRATHGPDAARPDHLDVPLPRQPARGARGLVAVVGLAAGPQAGLVLLRSSYAERDRRSSTTRGNLVIFWLGIAGDGLRGWAGWQPPQPVADAAGRPLGRPVAALGAHRPGHASSTTSTPACRSWSSRWRTSWPSCGTARRRVAWFLARVGAALAILGAPLLWLLREPLCLAADTQAVNAGSEACGALSRQVSLTDQSLAVLGVLVIGGTVILWQLWRASHAPRSFAEDELQPPPGGRVGRALSGLAEGPVAGIVVTVGAMLLAVVLCLVVFSDAHPVQLQVGANELALVALIVLAVPAWIALRARDARRFALGVVVAAALWLLIWYPNLTGLPMPNGLVNIYQGLLPTWNYAFQFATDMDPVVKGGMMDAGTLVIGLGAVVGVVAVMLVARRWRSHPPAEELADLV